MMNAVGRGILDAPVILYYKITLTLAIRLFPVGKSKNCANFRRGVREAAPYEGVPIGEAN